MGRFETEWLAAEENLAVLSDLSGIWIDRVHDRKKPKIDAMIELDARRKRGGLDVTQKIALEALERRYEEWLTCSKRWTIDFQRERQGLN